MDCRNLEHAEVAAQLLVLAAFILSACLGYMVAVLVPPRTWSVTLGQRIALYGVLAWALLSVSAELIDGGVAFLCP